MNPGGTSILCWNVAGWTTTAAHIRRLWGEQKGIGTYFNLLGADVIALQESKVSRKKLKENPFAAAACDKVGECIEGWESFWSSSTEKGMNGVVTFARKDSVFRAECDVLGDPELDAEGRCVVTQFSSFVLFNVYVVNARGGERYETKMRFLNKLREAMHRWRETTGLPLILAGDFNLSHRAEDCHWSKRRIHIQRLRDFDDETLLPRSEKERCLKAIEQHIEQQRKAVLENNGVAAKDTIASRCGSILLEALRESRSHQELTTSPSLGDGGSAELPARSSTATLTARELSTLNPESVWVESFTRGTTQSPGNRCWCRAASARVAGESTHRSEGMPWLRDDILGEDSMVDSFLHCHPESATSEVSLGSYTVFDQSRNKRFDNEGNRIDYILVDKSLAKALREVPRHQGEIEPIELSETAEATTANERTLSDTAVSPSAAPTVGFRSPLDDEFDGEQLKLYVERVTAGGRFRSAPFAGGGLPSLEKKEALLHCEEMHKPSYRTDILYCSPPQMSDHLAICCFLEGVLLQQRSRSVSLFDNTTRSIMYIPRVKTLSAFFQKGVKPTAQQEQQQQQQRHSTPPPTAGVGRKRGRVDGGGPSSGSGREEKDVIELSP